MTSLINFFIKELRSLEQKNAEVEKETYSKMLILFLQHNHSVQKSILEMNPSLIHSGYFACWHQYGFSCRAFLFTQGSLLSYLTMLVMLLYKYVALSFCMYQPESINSFYPIRVQFVYLCTLLNVILVVNKPGSPCWTCSLVSLFYVSCVEYNNWLIIQKQKSRSLECMPFTIGLYPIGKKIVGLILSRSTF